MTFPCLLDTCVYLVSPSHLLENAQNNLAELYSLLSLCLPKVFPLGMADDFVSSFSPQGKSKPGAVSHSMAELQTLLKPVFLRRTIAEAGIGLLAFLSFGTFASVTIATVVVQRCLQLRRIYFSAQ